jgi:hypothetical protein
MSSTSKGLARKSSAPRLKAFWAFYGLALKTITGNFEIVRSFSNTSKPSTPGMMMSSSMMSGFAESITSRASTPLRAVITS